MGYTALLAWDIGLKGFSDMGKCNGIFIMDSHQQVGVL
jgi:hypothetical protein